MKNSANPSWIVSISFQPIAYLPILYFVSNTTALTRVATAIQNQPSDVLVRNSATLNLIDDREIWTLLKE